MEVPATSAEDLLADPLRARLFGVLGELRRPATTQELAARVERHPNTVRIQLRRLADAGLLERHVTRQQRGRPRDEWAIARDAQPAGRPPEGYLHLSRWLTRAAAATGDLTAIEHAGREIGRELAPEASVRGTAAAMQDALAALGFAPRHEEVTPGRLRFTLTNCPYREAVRQNQAVVCRLHRGITTGLLERIDRGARLGDFVAKDPYAAGCLVELEGLASAG